MSADPQDKFELPPGQGVLARIVNKLPRIGLRFPRFNMPWPQRRGARGALIFLGGSIVAYYLIGMVLIHRIDDDTDFNMQSKAAGLRSVDMAAALIERETRQHSWVPNDPWFQPGAFLDNMRNYQMGMAEALRRYMAVLRDKIGRQRGSSRANEDLEQANSQMQVDSTQWLFNWPQRWLPITPAENAFAQVREKLLRYNSDLAAQRAVADPRADNLMELLDRIASDLGDASARIDGKIGLKPVHDTHPNGQETGVNLPDIESAQADDLFYYNKGLIYGYLMILQASRSDFSKVIEGREVAALYGNMISTMKEAAGLQPFVVTNGDPESNFMPNHLATQGFYILRARVQLREITATLANQK